MNKNQKVVFAAVVLAGLVVNTGILPALADDTSNPVVSLVGTSAANPSTADFVELGTLTLNTDNTGNAILDKVKITFSNNVTPAFLGSVILKDSNGSDIVLADGVAVTANDANTKTWQFTPIADPVTLSAGSSHYFTLWGDVSQIPSPSGTPFNLTAQINATCDFTYYAAANPDSQALELTSDEVPVVISNITVTPPALPSSTDPVATSTLTINVDMQGDLSQSDFNLTVVDGTSTIYDGPAAAAQNFSIGVGDNYSVTESTTTASGDYTIVACPFCSGTMGSDTITCTITNTAPEVTPVDGGNATSTDNSTTTDTSTTTTDTIVVDNGPTVEVPSGGIVGVAAGYATNSTGSVLGASTTDPAALAQLLHNLMQQFVTLEFKENNCSFVFNKNLFKGMTNADVKNLQTVLNYSPFTQVAETGPGSPWNENTYFGGSTKNAVIAFQNIFSEQILVPAGITSGNGYVGSSTRAILNNLCSK